MTRLAAEADTIFTDWKAKHDASLWNIHLDGVEQAYNALKQTLRDENAGDPDVYGQLVQDRQAVEQRLRDLVEQAQQVSRYEVEAKQSMTRLLELRRELTAQRAQFLNKVLADNRYVRITVSPYGAKESVEQEVRRLLNREAGGFEKDIGQPDGDEGLLAEIWESQPEATRVEEHLERFKQKVRAIAGATSEPPAVRDKRFADHLARLAPEAFDRLDLWFPEDSLDVRYSQTGDGRNLHPIHEGSPGQKTAALLAFLLSYGDEPLILDQPEDDLDNHLIYDLIVAQLREVKASRQLIIVTHNPNIVVNGDAELVIALQPRGGLSQKEAEGCLQERKVRDTICAIMEGGRDAFERRYRRMTMERSHV